MLCSETSQHCLQSNNLDLTLALSSICSIDEEIRAEGKVYVMCRHVKRPQRGCILIMKTRKIHLQHSFCLSIQVYITEEEMASRTQVPLLLSSLWYGLLNLSIQYIGQHLDLSKKKKKRERERESHLLARNLSGLGTELVEVAQLVKNLATMWETWVWSLGWEDPLRKGKATHSSILAWRIPWTTQSMGLQRVEHNWAAFTFTFFPPKSLDSKMKEKNKIHFSSHVFHHMFFIIARATDIHFHSSNRRSQFIQPWTKVTDWGTTVLLGSSQF